jgi:hypothetical protein
MSAPPFSAVVQKLAIVCLFIFCGAPMWAATDTWARAPDDLLRGGFARSGPFETISRKVAGGEIQIFLSSGQLPVGKDQLLGWVDQATQAVTTYYGRFPVAQLKLVLLLEGNARLHSGSEHDGELIIMKIGAKTSASDLNDDWQLTHEMFHLGFPDVPNRYHWMEEGLSTYLEPLARARIGNLKPEKVWTDLVEGLPQGLPQAGDRGLDRTPTWGRTYWGGALFWLLADVEIRERTSNQHSLDDAIRAIWGEGGDGASEWSAEKVLREGDRATGLTVLKDTHDKMGLLPAPVDLPALWKKLGVIYRDGTVTFDDNAPLAAVRRAITAGK